MNNTLKIFVAGHNGMVGKAICKELNNNSFSNVIVKNREKLDLTKQLDVSNFIESEKPDIIINAAARVGGILANNNYPYQFLMDNMQIQNNLISSAIKFDVKKFIFLGSSCIYPKLAKQPLKEEYLLTDFLEPTNEWYAIAKISGVKLCEAIKKQYNKDFVSLMPTNLYGPNDNFDLQTSHVLPAMIRKFHDAKYKNKNVVLWGSGEPMREFLYVEDLAKAVMFCIDNKLPDSLYNVGIGNDLKIKKLAKIIQKIIEYNGKIVWDSSKPDGTPRKLLDVSKLHNLGWKAECTLEHGIKKTYDWFLKNQNKYKELKIT